MLEVKSLKKALVPSSLIPNPSAGHLQSTRLALHVAGKGDSSSSSCWVYLASGCRIDKVHVSMEGSQVSQGKESLLIPEQIEVMVAPYWEVWILMVILLCLSWMEAVMNLWGGSEGSVLAVTEEYVDLLVITATGAVAAGGADRTVTVYDPRRWSALSRWLNCSKYEITGLAFSLVDPDYVYVQGVDYEVLCRRWKDSNKAFSFRGDSNWLEFSSSNRDILGGWCESGSIFIADIVAEVSNGVPH